MLQVGDIVQFTNKNAWGGWHHGIVEVIDDFTLVHTSELRMVRVRFETTNEQPYHFTVPVLEEWLEEVS